MKKIIFAVILILFVGESVSYAQTTTNTPPKDKCDCTKNIDKGEINIPYAKGITIIVYYNGKFLSNVIYDSDKEIKKDFPSTAKDSSTTLVFDWNNLSKLSKWNFVQTFQGKIYIGVWLDLAEDYLASETKICDIKATCGYYSCSPHEYQLYVKLFLEKKN